MPCRMLSNTLTPRDECAHDAHDMAITRLDLQAQRDRLPLLGFGPATMIVALLCASAPPARSAPAADLLVN